MNRVQPIRSKKKIEAMKSVLKDKNEKYYIMFLLGINSGLRVSDILPLKVIDALEDHTNVIEKKTTKNRRLYWNDSTQKAVLDFIKKNNLKADDYIIQSRKGENKPISRVQAYRILNDAADSVGITEIGTHTMRKTFGYHHYQMFHDIAILQMLFNHSSPTVTLQYIGITDDMIEDNMKKFCL